MSILNNWRRDVEALLFPPVCAVCGAPLVRGERSFCTFCRATAPLTGFWREAANPVADRFAGLVPVEQASAFLHFRPASGWRRAIHDFKYRAQWRLADELGRWYGAELAASGLYGGVEAVVPLPLHPFKQLQRGYNQSSYLAEGIAGALGVPVERRALRRTRNTSAQALKPHRERAANVAGAFRVRDASCFEGRHLLLVDDVLTTGSTLTAAAEAILAAAPDCRISIAVLAFAGKG